MSDIGTSVGKFLKHPDHIKAIQSGQAWPLHIDALCTSRCQLQCPFCAVRGRIRNVDLDFQVFKDAIDLFAAHGMLAIQFSGGETFLWPPIDEAIRYCHDKGVVVAILTNGLLAHKHAESLRHVKWMRVGVYSDDHLDALELWAVPRSVNVSISTVWHSDSEKGFIRRFGRYGSLIGAAHARVIQDLFDRDSEHARSVESLVAQLGPPLVFVRRPEGNADFCAIAWWRTILDWDGYLWPCGCLDVTPDGDLPRQMRICHVKDAEEFYRGQPRDLGHRCPSCVYAEQNALMRAILTPVDDPEFP